MQLANHLHAKIIVDRRKDRLINLLKSELRFEKFVSTLIIREHFIMLEF